MIRNINWRFALATGVLFLVVLHGRTQTADSIDNSNITHMGNFTPSSIVEEVTYNPTTDQYTITKKIGTLIISAETISSEEYRKRKLNQNTAEYWRKKELFWL